MAKYFSLTIGAAVTALAGCSFTPLYERPPAPVPAAYSHASATGDSTAMGWRDYFSDPVLQRLITLALDSNRDLQLALLNVEQARAQLQIQQSALMPSLSGVASANRGVSQVTGDLGNTFTAGVAVSAWELDFFGRIRSLKEAALAQYLASDEGRQAVELTLVSSVAQTWLALNADTELLEISQRTLRTREDSMRLARLRFDAGFSSELDYRQAESLTEGARATLAQQTRQQSLNENTLALLLGQPVPVDILTTLQGRRLATATALTDIPAGLPSDLLQRRPDIRAAEQQLIAANAQIGAARAAFFPSISLTGQYGSVSSELSQLFSSGTWGFSFGPSIQIPLFTGGRLRANLQATQAARDAAVAQYEKAIQVGFKEVSDALASRATLAEQARAQTAQAAAERKRFQLADLRYQNGVASYLDLLDAQRALFALEQADVQVRLAQQLNQVNLYKALGGGWTENAVGNPPISNR